MKRTALTIALLLALPASASAGDSGFAALGQKSTTATIRYVKCPTKLCRLHAATAFMKADTAMLTYMTRRANNGSIEAGSPCYKAAVKWSALPASKLPWKVGIKWLQGHATDQRLAETQVAWLQQAVRVAGAC